MDRGCQVLVSRGTSLPAPVACFHPGREQKVSFLKLARVQAGRKVRRTGFHRNGSRQESGEGRTRSVSPGMGGALPSPSLPREGFSLQFYCINSSKNKSLCDGGVLIPDALVKDFFFFLHSIIYAVRSSGMTRSKCSASKCWVGNESRQWVWKKEQFQMSGEFVC